VINTDTFISYRRQNSTHLARNIFTELTLREIKAFLDVENIDSVQFDTFILNQIEARPNFVLVLSPASLVRCTEPGDWLLREILHAVKTNRNIIPVWDAGFKWEEESQHLPDELQYLGLRNAVNFNHDYYEGFIEKIIRHINNPQDGHDIVVKRVSMAEAYQAEEAIRRVRVTSYQDDAGSVVELLGEYHKLKPRAKKTVEYEKLLQLWSRIHASGIPSYFEFDLEEKELREALDKQRVVEAEQMRIEDEPKRRERDYDLIRKMALDSRIPPAYLQTQLQAFWRQYGDGKNRYDPDDLSGERARQKEVERQSHEAKLREEKGKELAELYAIAVSDLEPNSPVWWVRLMWWRLTKKRAWTLAKKHWSFEIETVQEHIGQLSLGGVALVFALGVRLGTIPGEEFVDEPFSHLIRLLLSFSPIFIILSYMIGLIINRNADERRKRIEWVTIPFAFWCFLIVGFMITLVSYNPQVLSIAVFAPPLLIIVLLLGSSALKMLFKKEFDVGNHILFALFALGVVTALLTDWLTLVVVVFSFAFLYLLVDRAISMFSDNSRIAAYGSVFLVYLLVILISFFGAYRLLPG
jgi:hypothetical protein